MYDKLSGGGGGITGRLCDSSAILLTWKFRDLLKEVMIEEHLLRPIVNAQRSPSSDVVVLCLFRSSVYLPGSIASSKSQLFEVE